MADDKRKRLPKLTTPRGTFRYPYLTEPSKGTKEFPKPDGEYKVELVLDAAAKETKTFIKALQPLYEAAIEDAKRQFSELKAESRKRLKEVQPNALFVEQLDPETEEPTGRIVFKFKRPASGVYKTGPKAGQRWSAKIPIFDASGKRIDKAPAIWGGTVGKLAFEAAPYFVSGTAACGLSLKLQGVQVLELVTAGGRTAESLGFGEEEGYQHEDSDDVPAAEAGSDPLADVNDGSADF